MASAATRERIAAARLELAEARGRPAEEVIESERHALSMQLFESCARVTHAVKDLREQLDLLLTHRVWGYLFLGGMLAAFFGMVYGTGSLLELNSEAVRPDNQRGYQLARCHRTRIDDRHRTVTRPVGWRCHRFAYLLPFLIGMAVLEMWLLAACRLPHGQRDARIGLHGVAIVPAIWVRL
jgi:ferrous iron transport protein B